MAKENLKLNAEPTQEQLALQIAHIELCDEFLYDANGTTIYAVCEDGLVAITSKTMEYLHNSKN